MRNCTDPETCLVITCPLYRESSCDVYKRSRRLQHVHGDLPKLATTNNILKYSRALRLRNVYSVCSFWGTLLICCIIFQHNRMHDIRMHFLLTFVSKNLQPPLIFFLSKSWWELEKMSYFLILKNTSQVEIILNN